MLLPIETQKPISPQMFKAIRQLFHDESGILLKPGKKTLVENRLRSRLDQLGLENFDDYYQMIQGDDGMAERRMLVDRLTTNETYFFREPIHFDHLSQTVLPACTRQPLRIWSAAAASGEEPYSIAMTLNDQRPAGHWEVVATDLSRTVLAKAVTAVYPAERLDNMPPGYLQKYCLRGTGNYEGTIRVHQKLRSKVSFAEHNLLHSPSHLGQFDLIFLRNVLIYFEADKKRQIVSQALHALRPGGWLYLSSSESLSGLDLPLHVVRPSIYRKR